jgi:hypothetical protein
MAAGVQLEAVKKKKECPNFWDTPSNLNLNILDVGFFLI